MQNACGPQAFHLIFRHGLAACHTAPEHAANVGAAQLCRMTGCQGAQAHRCDVPELPLGLTELVLNQADGNCCLKGSQCERDGGRLFRGTHRKHRLPAPREPLLLPLLYGLEL